MSFAWSLNKLKRLEVGYSDPSCYLTAHGTPKQVSWAPGVPGRPAHPQVALSRACRLTWFSVEGTLCNDFCTSTPKSTSITGLVTVVSTR